MALAPPLRRLLALRELHLYSNQIGAVGVEAPHVKVELNPLSGDASGRGEVTFRNVTDKQKLLDLLHARPAALMHGRAVQVTYDDTEPKSARAGA